EGPGALLMLGALAEVMLLLSPVCHLHYFCLSAPLVMALVTRLEGRGGWLLAGAYFVAGGGAGVAGWVAAPHVGGAGGRALGVAALELGAVGCVALAWGKAPGPGGSVCEVPLDRTPGPRVRAGSRPAAA